MAKATTLSDYELRRQEKIAENRALLKDLQLKAASAGLAPKSTPARTSNAAPRSRKRPPPKVKEEIGPRRTSSRLRGIVADSEVAKHKAEEEYEAIRAADRAKRQRVSGDLNLGDISVGGQTWNQSGNWLRDVKPANPYERTFGEEDVKKTTSKELKELREKMSGLELWQGFEPTRIKITPERIYSLAFHPTTDKQLVIAGDKLGSLGIFDGSQAAPKTVKNEDDEDAEEEAEPAISIFKQHTRTIASIQSIPSEPNLLYTASYDSSIRKLDLNKGVSVEAYAPASADEDEPLSGVQIPYSEPHMLYFASLNGMFGMHDTRTDPATKSNTTFLQLSEKKIGGFSIHPQCPHLVATASLDRTVKLWDLRRITGKGASRLPSLLGEHESRLSVSHASFNGMGQVATSSYDDTIKIYDFATKMGGCADWPVGKELGDELMKPTTVIPHNNQTGRWVTILKPQWQARPSAVGGGVSRFVIGNMNRFVDVYAGSGEQLAQLGGEGITAVPAVASFHESCDWIAAGTASGKLCLWI